MMKKIIKYLMIYALVYKIVIVAELKNLTILTHFISYKSHFKNMG